MGILAFAAVNGFDLAFPVHSLSLGDLAFFAVGGALGTRYWVFRSYARSDASEPWLVPSWSESPFQLNQPFQFFHLAAWAFVVFFLAAFVRKISLNSHLNGLPVEAMFGAFGAGMLIGMKWAVMSCKDKFTKT